MDGRRYQSVDDLQAQLTLQEAALRCGVTLDVQGTGRQVRIDCPFGCPGDHAGKHELSVDNENPQRVFFCHSYQCQMRGNLLTLMHGWSTGIRPTGDKLKGEEFRRVKEIVVGKNLHTATAPSQDARLNSPAPSNTGRNIPLAESENEKTRELVTLSEKFIVDVAHMPPAAASYVRRHRCLTPESMRKWRVGVLPMDGGSDKRGWSLRGQVIYPVLAEDGQLLAWVSRDPEHESKEQAFNALPPDRRAKEQAPMKYRIPKGFSRRWELFGQHAGRLEEPGYRELIAKCGIIVTEGFNDVIGLDSLGVPAVAIMSNKICEEQLPKIERRAKLLANGKVTLMFDADLAGDEGAKEALWLLAQRELNVRLGWTRSMYGGKFDGRQPESLTQAEWKESILPVLVRSTGPEVLRK